MPDGSANAFMFKPAVRENTPIIMALAGASGSGKTFTALELAMGLSGDGKIAVIDTEGRRALHYADLRDQRTGEVLFRFDHCELRPLFHPKRFIEAMTAAERAGYRVIVVDSFSDEHEGEGGLIDMAAADTSPNSAAKWAKPKAEHKQIVRWLRQTRCHVLFCLRAEERVRLEKDEKGKTIVVPIGWVPICEKRFMYDMTASFLLDPKNPGIPEPIKLQEQHRRYFPTGQFVTRESGQQLAAWAAGGVPAMPYEPTLDERARVAAEKGDASLRRFWDSLPPAEKRQLKPLLEGELKIIAAEADRKADADVSFDDPPAPAGDTRAEDIPAGEITRHGGAPSGVAEGNGAAIEIVTSDGEVIEAGSVEALRAKWDELFGMPMSPDQIIGMWNDNGEVRKLIYETFGSAAMKRSLERYKQAETEKRRIQPGLLTGLGQVPGAPSDESITLNVDEGWGIKRAQSEFRRALTQITNLAPELRRTTIERFRQLNGAVEIRLNQRDRAWMEQNVHPVYAQFGVRL